MSTCIRNQCSLLLLIGICVMPGCAMMNAGMLRLPGKKPEFQIPRQMVPVWSDTVLHQAGEPATRGFGGRIMFYGNDKHKPIRVQGALVVYVWDDSQGSMERTPDRKYVFSSEKLQSHYSESRLGHSYSFWLPWDAAGGDLTHLTLISRFIANEGTELTSSPAHVVLQGPVDPLTERNAARGGHKVPAETAIQQAGFREFDSDASSAGRRASGLKASAINLPDGFYERNVQGRFPADTDSGSGSRNGSKPQAEDPSAELWPDTPHAHRSQGRKESSSTAFQNTRSVPTKTSNDSQTNRDANQQLWSTPETAVAGKTAESDQRSTRLTPFESRVRTSRAIRSTDDPLRKEPHRATWLNGLPETPRSSNRVSQ